MSRKIKHTKNELKAQRNALRRYARYLPMLLLKKQQLQVEIHTIDARLNERAEQESAERTRLAQWVKLMSQSSDIDAFIRLEKVNTDEGNIAGVAIPVLTDVSMLRLPLDLFATPPWYDDAVTAIDKLIRLRVEQEVLREQRRLIADELRVTSQRVNLFEKVKIPECRENIRVIRIFLGDEQTASVARGKLAKKRTAAVEG